MTLKKNDCGKHWSSHGGKCRKCAYLTKYYHKNRHKLQASGTSGAALIGKRVKDHNKAKRRESEKAVLRAHGAE